MYDSEMFRTKEPVDMSVKEFFMLLLFGLTIAALMCLIFG